MSQMEEFLMPLKKDLSESFLDSNPKLVVINLMRKLENRPIRSSEINLIKSTIQDYRAKYNLLGDEQLEKILNKRFSFEYFPSISTLDLGPSEIDLQKSIIIAELEPKEVPASAKPLNKNTSWKVNGYMMCSIRRHQSTLWTSYRMYLDATRDINNTGELSDVSKNEIPVMMLGTKKLKSGISTSCFVWCEADSRTWKEKNAIAKIMRVSSTYMGVAVSNTKSGASSVSTSEEPSSPTSTSRLRDSQEGDADDINDQVDETGNEEASNPVVSSHVSLTSAPVIGAPIALTVSSKGLDKLIHLTVLVPKQTIGLSPTPPHASPSVSNRLSLSFAGGNSALSGGQTSISGGETPDEGAQVVTELERALKTVSTTNGRVDSGTVALSSKYLIMRSRLPRKTSAGSTGSLSSSGLSLLGSTGTKSMHTLAFGKDTRVKSASRKNLVVDSVFSTPLLDDSGSPQPSMMSTEWASEGDRTPILEIGKMEEDVFAVDFHHLTPFQAFTIAIAAFDQ